MHRLITLSTPGEQASHVLLLLGAPAPTRLVVDVHVALFDGDLSMTALAGVGQGRIARLSPALRTDLTALPGMITLTEWSPERRIITPAGRRADELAMIVRVAEFIAQRSGAGRVAHRLLRALAHRVPHGDEAADLAEAARTALADPALAARLAAEAPLREAAVRQAATLSQQQQLFGAPGVPQQRCGR